MSIERNIIKKEIKSMWKDHSQSSKNCRKILSETVFPTEVNAAEFLTSWKKVHISKLEKIIKISKEKALIKPDKTWFLLTQSEFFQLNLD